MKINISTLEPIKEESPSSKLTDYNRLENRIEQINDKFVGEIKILAYKIEELTKQNQEIISKYNSYHANCPTAMEGSYLKYPGPANRNGKQGPPKK